MKKFKFKLQSVHRVREMHTERESLALSELRLEAERAEARVAQIEAMRNEAVEKYLHRLRSGEHLNPLEMELNANHFASLNTLQKDAQREVEEKHRACARQIERLKAARIDMKVTDKLRTDQQRRHQAEAERNEQTAMDELTTAKFARRVQQTK